MILDDWFQATDCLLGEESIPRSSSFLMLIMSNSIEGRGSISERVVCKAILIPAAVVAVQLVVEIRVIDMDLIWTNTDERTCSDLKVSSGRVSGELMRGWVRTWASCHISDAVHSL